MDIYPTTLAALGVEWGSESLGLGVNLFSGEPTLCEELGIVGFIYHLASKSDFYSQFLIESEVDSSAGTTSIEDEVGIGADREMADKIYQEQEKRDILKNSDAEPENKTE